MSTLSKKEQKALIEKEITAGLRSRYHKSIMKALRQVRKDGTNAHIPILIELLRAKNDNVNHAALNVLSDIKRSSAVEVLMHHLEAKENADIAGVIACTMWQTGLNFNDYLENFVHLAINGSLHLAIECSTLVEQCTGEYDDDLLLGLAAEVKKAIPQKEDEDIQTVLSDLNHILTNRVIGG